MRCVLDANVWLSGLFWEGEASKIIELAEQKKIEVFVSKELLQEIVDVLSKEAKFQKFLDNKKQKIGDLIRKMLSIGNLIRTKSRFDIVEVHEADNRILELAVDCMGSYIISYNNHLLDVKEFKGIKIIKPNEFLNLFR